MRSIAPWASRMTPPCAASSSIVSPKSVCSRCRTRVASFVFVVRPGPGHNEKADGYVPSMYLHGSYRGRCGRYLSGRGARTGGAQALPASAAKIMRFPEETLQGHAVVSREEWLVARRQLLLREKELTRQRDVLSAERRRLPWVKVEKHYVFDTTDGRQSLADLFAGRSQLIIHHFMMGPG